MATEVEYTPIEQAMLEDGDALPRDEAFQQIVDAVEGCTGYQYEPPQMVELRGSFHSIGATVAFTFADGRKCKMPLLPYPLESNVLHVQTVSVAIAHLRTLRTGVV